MPSSSPSLVPLLSIKPLLPWKHISCSFATCCFLDTIHLPVLRWHWVQMKVTASLSPSELAPSSEIIQVPQPLLTQSWACWNCIIPSLFHSSCPQICHHVDNTAKLFCQIVMGFALWATVAAASAFWSYFLGTENSLFFFQFGSLAGWSIASRSPTFIWDYFLLLR